MWDDLEKATKRGALVKAHAYGHLLHPVYQGMVLIDLNLKDTTLGKFVADNEFADEENVIADDLNEADIDDEENFLMGTFYKPRQTQSQPQSQSLIPQTPLQAEVARCMSKRYAADRPKKGTPAFDVLGWWSAQEKIFLLMSKAAKN